MVDYRNGVLWRGWRLFSALDNFVITTAGNDPDRLSIGWEVHEQARKIRDGELIDDTWYVKIYAAPEECDIYDEANWYLANPSLGISISIESVRQEAVAARNSEHAERNFRWLRLNHWVSVKRVGWLPITLWDATEGDWSVADMVGQECYVGIDLSSKTDLTGLAVLFPPRAHKDWRFTVEAFIPAENIKDRISRDHVPFDSWIKGHHITATPGNVVDYGFVSDRIAQLEKLYKVKYFCADPWHLEFLRQLLPPETQDKFIEISQSMAGMSSGMGELERMFRATEITHNYNPMGRWAFGNVAVHTDGNENIKPMKNKSIERIDPIVALINAMAGAIKLEPKKSVYEDRGIRVV